MNNNGAFRSKKIYFSQVSNEALRDSNLSLKAKGLYALIQSYVTIENFVLYKSTLKKDCKEGEKAFEASWKELKDRGYLVQYKMRNEKGSFYYEYDLLDVSQTPKKEGVENGHVEKGGGGKRGVYNNTDLNNTDLVVVDHLVKEFEENICDLKKTTKNKFIEYCKKYSEEYIMTVLEICAESGIKSFAGFKTVIDAHIKNGNNTPEKIKAAVEKYRQERKNKKKIPTNKKKSTFDNFKQRNYNFGDLEEMLLGHMNYDEDEE